MVGLFLPIVFCLSSPANVKCQPPAMRISNISKHPFDTQVVFHDESNKMDKFNLTSSLAPDCNISKVLVYSWEIASVDTDTGMFNRIFQFGKADNGTKKATKEFWKGFINPPGLQYVRCIARVVYPTGIHLLTYDFGFFRLIRKRPLDCKVPSMQGMPSFIKFTLQCKNGYKGIQASGYTFTGLDSRSNILARSEWRSPNGTITLPVTDVSPMENYSIRVKVEAKYFSIPSLFFELVIMESLECKAMSSQRMPTFEKFTLHCEGGYKDVQATSYVATALDSSNRILNSSKWGSSNGSVNLTAGDGYGMEGYNVRVKVEAKYLSLPSLFDDIVVKVGWYKALIQISEARPLQPVRP